LKKAWAWCKKYWQLFVGAAIPILIWIFTRKSDNLDEVLERVREDHKKEIDVIDESHAQEIAARDAALKKYSEVIGAVEKKYEEAKKELSEKKKKEIKKVIEGNIEDPDEITKRLSEITGFDIHVD
jgi:aspartyl/asparaginyl-tRNA synthetase